MQSAAYLLQLSTAFAYASAAERNPDREAHAPFGDTANALCGPAAR